jgi:hypothetical protein
MTIDELAGRLELAAAEIQGIRAELERSQPMAPSGPRRPEALEQIRLAWVAQRELAGRVAGQIRGLADDVAQAAQTYRAADELGRGHGQG